MPARKRSITKRIEKAAAALDVCTDEEYDDDVQDRDYDPSIDLCKRKKESDADSELEELSLESRPKTFHMTTVGKGKKKKAGPLSVSSASSIAWDQGSVSCGSSIIPPSVLGKSVKVVLERCPMKMEGLSSKQTLPAPKPRTELQAGPAPKPRAVLQTAPAPNHRTVLEIAPAPKSRTVPESVPVPKPRTVPESVPAPKPSTVQVPLLKPRMTVHQTVSAPERTVEVCIEDESTVPEGLREPPSAAKSRVGLRFTTPLSPQPSTSTADLESEEEVVLRPVVNLTVGKQKGNATASSLGNSTAVEKSSKGELLACDLCGVLRNRLDRHFKRKHGLDDNAAKARAKLLKGPMKKSGKEPLVCPICRKACAHLAEHLAAVHLKARDSDESQILRQEARQISTAQQLEKLGEGAQNTNKRKVTGVDNLLTKFQNWCLAPDRCTEVKNAQAHRRQVLMVWKRLGSQTLLLEDFTPDNLEATTSTMMKDTKPNTLRSYLLSVKWFLKFLSHKELKQKTLPENLTYEDICLLREECDSYMKVLNKKGKQDLVTRALENYESILDPQMIIQMEESQYTNEVENILLSGQLYQSKATYCHIRNHLMALLVATNGQRSSAVCNIQAHNVYAASRQEDGYRTVGSSRHKTSFSRGVANFSLTERQYKLLKMFTTQSVKSGPEGIRNPNKEEALPIFLTSGPAGHPLDASNAAKCIKEGFVKAGVADALGITVTKIRQLITTVVRDDAPNMGTALAQQLSHSETTATKNYMLPQSQRQSVKVVKQIKESMQKRLLQNQASATVSRAPDSDEEPEIVPELVSEEDPANVPERVQFDLLPSTKEEFLDATRRFINSLDINQMVKRARDHTRKMMDKSRDRFNDMFETSHYMVYASLDSIVESKYDLNLVAVICELCPRVVLPHQVEHTLHAFIGAELGSSFTTEKLRLMEQPFKAAPETVRQETTLQALVTERTEVPEVPVEMPLAEALALHGEQLETTPKPNPTLEVPKKKPRLYWSSTETELLKKEFLPELQTSLLEQKKISSKFIKEKLRTEILKPIADKFTFQQVLDKLWAMVRHKESLD